MTVQDGTPREKYSEPRDARGRPARSIGWPIIVAFALAVVLGFALLSAFNLSEDRTVTNAPAGTPPSVQQPDTTPPVNQNPAQGMRVP